MFSKIPSTSIAKDAPGGDIATKQNLQAVTYLKLNQRDIQSSKISAFYRK